jgi:ABC-type lipoprotein release transport system permease subunit
VIGGVTSSLHQPGAYGSFAALALLLANIGIYGVRRRAFSAVAITLLIAALMACYVSARRAAKADPIVALRIERLAI